MKNGKPAAAYDENGAIVRNGSCRAQRTQLESLLAREDAPLAHNSARLGVEAAFFGDNVQELTVDIVNDSLEISPILLTHLSRRVSCILHLDRLYGLDGNT